MTTSRELPAHADVVVIGGGIMGCSTLYHLAKLDLSDVVLLERNQLTSGTTWHSAAQVRQLRSSRSLTRLTQYSAKLYSELEAETGQQTGWNRTGSLSIAANADRWIHVRRQTAMAQAYGVAAHEVSMEEVKSLWPLLNCEDLVGAVYAPDDGRVNPSDVCAALAKGARTRGAQIFENTSVVGLLKSSAGRIAGVSTDVGEIRADRIVICGGLWSRELAALAGIAAPLLACEHFYLLTQPMDGVDGHLPTLSDHDSHLYIRDDVGGLLVGCFEPGARSIHPDRLGKDFAFSLLNEDWEHFEPMMRNAMHRIPALESAQARMLLNGPESFTPDGAFLLGETATVPGLFLGCGMNSVGMATGGGAGWALAQWVADGAPAFDLGEASPNRFHVVENQLEQLMQRIPEVLGRHYEIQYPGRQWRTARNLRRTPLHRHWEAAGARFAQVYGWERPQYFSANGEPELCYGRPPWFSQVETEVRAATESVAVFDLSTYGKIRVCGPDAERVLNHICANDMTRNPGRVIYSAMLNERGGFESDLTALRLGADEYLLYVGTSAVAQDLAWLRRHMHGTDVEAEDVTVLGVMGPESRRIAQALGAPQLLELSYFCHMECTVAGVHVRAAKVSYVGEDGWELACSVADADSLYQALLERGATPAGTFAQTSMRVEKGFLAMGHDLDRDTTPLEAGLMFAVKKTGDFVGADALRSHAGAGPSKRVVTLILDDPDADPHGDETVYCDDQLVGQATSAAFGYRVGCPVALAYVDASFLERGVSRVALDIAGQRYAATLSTQAAYDPTGQRLRCC